MCGRYCSKMLRTCAASRTSPTRVVTRTGCSSCRAPAASSLLNSNIEFSSRSSSTRLATGSVATCRASSEPMEPPAPVMSTTRSLKFSSTLASGCAGVVERSSKLAFAIADSGVALPHTRTSPRTRLAAEGKSLTSVPNSLAVATVSAIHSRPASAISTRSMRCETNNRASAAGRSSTIAPPIRKPCSFASGASKPTNSISLELATCRTPSDSVASRPTSSARYRRISAGRAASQVTRRKILIAAPNAMYSPNSITTTLAGTTVPPSLGARR